MFSTVNSAAESASAIEISTVFAGQRVGIRGVADEVWLVSFMHYDLGFFDNAENRVEPVGETPSLQNC